MKSRTRLILCLSCLLLINGCDPIGGFPVLARKKAALPI